MYSPLHPQQNLAKTILLTQAKILQKTDRSDLKQNPPKILPGFPLTCGGADVFCPGGGPAMLYLAGARTTMRTLFLPLLLYHMYVRVVCAAANWLTSQSHPPSSYSSECVRLRRSWLTVVE